MAIPPSPPAARPGFVVPATSALAGRLAAALAPEHAREARELCRVAPEAAVEMSLAASREAYAALGPGGGPLFLMGVEDAGALGRAAMVWMLAGPDASRCPARILRAAKWGVGRAFAVTGADTLMQFIPEWYGVGRSFAARLGFTLRPLPGRPVARGVLLATLAYSDFTTKGDANGSRNHQHHGSRRACRRNHAGAGGRVRAATPQSRGVVRPRGQA